MFPDHSLDLLNLSLLFYSSYTDGQFEQIVPLLAEYAMVPIHLKTPEHVAWDRHVLIYYEKRKGISPLLAEELVENGLVSLENLWFPAIANENMPLLQWLRDMGADLGYVFEVRGDPFVLHSNFAGACIDSGTARMFNHLMDAGLDANATTIGIRGTFPSMWAYFGEQRSPDQELLAAVASRTDDLFSNFYGHVPYPEMKYALFAELKRRVEEGSIDLLAYNTNSACIFFGEEETRMWMFDRIIYLYGFGRLLELGQFLYDAGFTTAYPAITEFLFGDRQAIKRKFLTGEADINEMFGYKHLLEVVIKLFFDDEDELIWLVENGAYVNTAYFNARSLLMYFHEECGGKKPSERLLAAIAAKKRKLVL